MPGSLGIARERADAGESAGLEKRAVPSSEQVGMGLKQVQHLGETTGVAATYARAFLQSDGLREAVPRKHLVRDLQRLLQAHRRAQAIRSHLEEDLVGNVVVRGEQQLG